MLSILSDLSILLNAFGAGVGIFWAFLLFSRSNESRGNFFLAALLFLFVAFMVNTIIQLSGYGKFIQIYQIIANALTLLIGPFLLAYGLTYTRKHEKWMNFFWVHYIPFLLLSPAIFLNATYYDNKFFNLVLIYFWNFQMLFYLGWGYHELRNKNAWHSLPALVIRYFCPLWLVNLVLFLAKTYWYPIPDVIFLNVTLLFYLLICAVALRHFKTMRQEKRQSQIFSLSENHYQDYSLRLQSLMERKQLYRNPNLNIQELAQLAKIPPRYVSATLNHQMKQSFYEFVNSYRIKEVVERLHDQDADTLTLVGIAQQAGFKSNSAFYKAFKVQTG